MPAITTQPSSKTTYRGGSVSLTCIGKSFTGGSPTYAWKKTGSSTTLSSQSTYYPKVNTVGTATYYCVVSDNGGSVTSNSATVTVQATPTPSVSGPYGGGPCYRGATVRLSVSASVASGALSYQWRVYSGGHYSNISGATSSSYYPSTASVGATTYICVVTNTLNGYTSSASSSTTTVTVLATPVPTVTGATGGKTVYQGGSSPLSVSASVTAGTLSYQWQSQVYGTSTWTAISGANKATYSPANATVGRTNYRCVVTNTLNGYTTSATSSLTTVDVQSTPIPSITSQSVNSAPYYRGASATAFSCAASASSGSVSYQWQSSANGSSWNSIGSATGTSYTPTTGTVGTTYYRCLITNSLNGYTKTTTSNTATITVNATPAPVLTSAANLNSASYFLTQTATALNASATSASGTVSYNWQQSIDGASWYNSGVTSATLTPDTSVSGVTYYRCVVSNTLHGYTASITTGTAQITVLSAPPPTITRNPESASYYVGATPAALTVSATASAGTLNYQWQQASGGTWTDIFGQTTTQYVPDTETVATSSFRCVVTNTLSGVTASTVSRTAVVTVLDTPVPAFTNAYTIRSATYKQNHTAAEMDGTATVAAGTVTYQWQKKDGNGNWQDIPGATNAKFTPSTESIGSETYRCVATNTLNGRTKTAASDAAVITIDYAVAPTPTFTSAYSVASATYYRGQPAVNMNAQASAPAGTITYQWQQSVAGGAWTDIPGANGYIYLPSTSAVGAITYRCVVTNTYDGTTSTLTSNEANITVSATPAPEFVDQGSMTGYAYWQGATADTLSVTASAEQGAITYQWQQSANGTDYTNILGATGSQYTPPTGSTGTVYYRCVATNTLYGYTAQTASNAATVTVSASVAPTITADPQSASYYVAATPTPLYAVFETPTSPLSYQWQQSATGSAWTDITGATEAEYSPSTATANTMYYRVTVYAGNPGFTQSATSGSAAIAVSVPAPTFVKQPISSEYNLRANAQPLDAQASAPGCELSYQWQRRPSGETNWANITGATESTYTPYTAPRGTVEYRCIATATNNNQSASATSSAASILVFGGQAPIFERRLQDGVYKVGDAIQPLNGTASSQDTTDIRYQWYWSRDGQNFLPIDNATGPYYTPVAMEGGTYYYYVVATAYFADETTTQSRSNTASITITNAQYSYGEAWRAYLAALKTDFVKLARLEFLQPDGSVAFALDNNPKNRRSGAFIQSGQLSVNLQNGQRRTATVTIANLDNEYDYNVNKVWFGQQILLSEGLILPNGQEFYLPQGVFYIREPEEKMMPNMRTVTYHLEDKWSYLNGTLFGNLDGIYEIPLNTNVFDAIQSVLNLDRGNGQKVDSVAPVYTNYYNDQMTTLPGGSMISDLLLPYTYRNDAENGTYADIVLEMSNILAAWVGYDATGRLRVDPSQDDIVDATKAIQWEFRPDEKQFLGATYTIKNTDVFNDVIITGESLSGYGYISGRAQNQDPSSDTNINMIGLKTKKENAAGFYTEKQCENLAIFRLKQQTVLQKSVTIQSAQLFHINENQLVTIRRPDKPGTPLERHLVTGFTRPIAQTGAMQINATSVNDFLSATVIYPGGQSRSSALLVGTMVIGSEIVAFVTAN